MAKRPRSWDNDFERQKKVFLNEKFVNLNNPDYMEKVYEKTLLCLYNGSNKHPSETISNQLLDDSVTNNEEGEVYFNPLDVEKMLPMKNGNKSSSQTTLIFSPLSVWKCNGQKYSEPYPEEEKNSLIKKSRNYRQLRLDKLWTNQKQVEFSCSNEDGCKVEPKTP